MKQKIIEYLEQTIISKKNMQKRIYQLEAELKEARKNEEYAIKQMNKYKLKIKKIKEE